MLKNIKTPPPHKFQNTKDFFKEFYAFNKTRNKFFSFRSFAEAIDWPTSYLSDLVSGRKKLTVAKAQEFSEFFKLNPVEKEHLLLFALPPSEDSQRKKKMDPNPLLHKHVSPIENVPDLCNLIMIVRLLNWKKVNLSAKDIQNKFAISLPLAEIQDALNRINELGIFEWNDHGKLEKSHLERIPEFIDHADTKGDRRYEGLEWHQESIQNFLQFIKEPQSPSTYHSSMVAIPRDQFMAIGMKIIELRNWVEEISKQHMETSSHPDESSILMQLDLNLFPVARKPRPPGSQRSS